MNMEMPQVKPAEKDHAGDNIAIKGVGELLKKPKDKIFDGGLKKEGAAEKFEKAGLSAEEIQEVLELTDSSLESTGFYTDDKNAIAKVGRISDDNIVVVVEKWHGVVMAGQQIETTYLLVKKDGKWEVAGKERKEIALS